MDRQSLPFVAYTHFKVTVLRLYERAVDQRLVQIKDESFSSLERTYK